MNHSNGASCGGELSRSTTVALHCSAPRSVAQSTAPLPPIDDLAEYSPSYIAAVHEPSTCVYVLHWHTPLVCSAYRAAVDDSDAERTEQPVQQELEQQQEEKGQTSLATRDSVEVRGYLDCIAAMSDLDARDESYQSKCAAYESSSQLQQQHSQHMNELT